MKGNEIFCFRDLPILGEFIGHKEKNRQSKLKVDTYEYRWSIRNKTQHGHTE